MAEWNNGTEDQWGGGQDNNAAWGGGQADNAAWEGGAAGQDVWGQNATEWNEGDVGGSASFNDAGATGDMGMGMNGNDGEKKCFGCGEPGHRRDECPSGTDMVCFTCKQPGHISKECPDKKPLACHRCGEEGHIQNDCDKPIPVKRDDVADVSPDDAWKKLVQATKERDIDDAKEALQEYVKALDGVPTFKELQMSFIDNGINFWFIGLERNLEGAFTNMDLQGHIGKKYTVSYRFSEKPSRPREREGWPESREELISRLDDAGDTVESGKTRCHNCDEYGHNSKSCPEPERERVKEARVCNNCKEEGHLQRNCPQPRVDKSACRNCNQSGHNAKDCPEPPNMDNVDCRKCGEKGHMAKDCPQAGGDMACHNCGKEGHMRKDCDQPRDYSKVQCSNCQQFGHTKVRCKQPTAEGLDDDDAPGGGNDASWNVQAADDSWGQGNAVDTQFNGASDGW